MVAASIELRHWPAIALIAVLFPSGPCWSDVVPPPGPAVVMRIIDGDTLRVRLPGGKRARTVRLRDVDAPELKGRCPTEIALAHRAKAELERLAPVGSTVTLSATKSDKYENRIDAKVHGPSGDVSTSLLAAGLVRPYKGGTRGGWC